ncbi:hypothetical protein NM208_g6042 [Fusarium decemcellulare]|uniref:Uncharacterized protein n=1 Tax=Fusarium decemcellulare TaxID=57161 RepID=A0ACC1SEL6_9HYPO|nr:hypothetical protein NM208_g6042 [Fusarium decemcellulare]
MVELAPSHSTLPDSAMRFRRRKNVLQTPPDASWVTNPRIAQPGTPTSHRLASEEQEATVRLRAYSQGSRTDTASEYSQQSLATTQSSEPERTAGKPRKKRYAKQHHHEWLQYDEPVPSSSKADQEAAQPISGPSEPGNGPRQAPLAASPSIFQLPASLEGKQGHYDAPPICPQIQSHYSPHGGGPLHN